MNNNFTMTEQLIRYLDNALDENERALLDAKLQADAGLQAELEGLRLAQRAVKLYGLRQQVAGIHMRAMAEMRQQQAAPQPISMVRRITRYGLRVAAAAIIVISATVAYQYTTVSSAKIFNDNYNPYSLPQTRGTETNALKQAYAANNMQAVTQQFREETNPSAEDYYIAGNAYMQLNDAANAIACFTSLQQKNSRDNTGIYAEDAEYYLALAYIQHSEPAKALPLFTHIHNDKAHAYHDKVSSWQLTRLGWLAKKK